ncbi:hypothetical protein V1508DRAFT_356783 [Lipomyces doorenjongii]|uniref:uncharacterized protein n=1 Tax=Lipomyces doorenjongii TaxID=383834 RepID=UPI0034CE0DC4
MWSEQHIKHNINFGFSSTSPVEASHHSLKAGMLSASAILHASILRLLKEDLWSQQLKDISKSRKNFSLPLSIRRNDALRVIEKEIGKMADGYGLETPCTCTAKQRFLLPCRLDIIRCLGAIHVAGV